MTTFCRRIGRDTSYTYFTFTVTKNDKIFLDFSNTVLKNDTLYLKLFSVNPKNSGILQNLLATTGHIGPTRGFSQVVNILKNALTSSQSSNKSRKSYFIDV